MRRSYVFMGLLASAMLVPFVGCADDAPRADPSDATLPPIVIPPSPTGTDSGEAGPPVAIAGPQRHPIGHTLVLPKGSWKLDAAPADNKNAVFVENGRSLFVPHLPGPHVFVEASGRSFRASAVLAESLAFHNVNHYPTRAIDEAGSDGLWVASVLTPEIVRVDRGTFQVGRRIPVGAWPVAVRAVPSKKAILVANRGEDTLSYVDVESGRVVRSIFVGDEVSNVDVTQDGSLALALSSTDDEVVVIDLATQSVKSRIKVGVDPAHVAITADGTRAYVAGRRTGEAANKDLVEIDLKTLTVTRSVDDVGTTIGGLTLSPDGSTLYVATLRNDPRASLVNPDGGTFRHWLLSYDLTAPTVVQKAAKDVTLSVAVEGTAAALVSRRLVSLHAPVVSGADLWVLSEANDMAVRFSQDTFEERERVAVEGRPRSLMVAKDGGLFAYGHQGLVLTEINKGRTVTVAKDPRPSEVASGQRFFTGPGQFTPAGPPASGLAIAGDRWSCNSCHADGSSDKLVWQAGPVPSHRYASRPYVMLEATWPLGWQGYLSSVRNYAVTVTGNVGITNPSTADVTGLAAYLSSIMPPASATSLTERDGALSAEAEKGGPIFQQHCGGCHAGSLTTSRRRVDKSLNDGKVADIPSLIGVYRQGVFFRDGSAKTLDQAVDAMIKFSEVTLSPVETASLKRYVAELTSRDFFPTSTFPSTKVPLSARSDLAATFSYPVLSTKENLAKIRVLSEGKPVSATAKADGRRVVLTPDAALPAGGKVSFVVDAGFESEDGRTTAKATTADYEVAQTPALKLSGTYTLSYTPVSFGPPGAPPATLSVTLVATPNEDGSSKIVVSYPQKVVEFSTVALISGKVLVLPPLPLTVSGSFADGFSGFSAELVDTNGDGIADNVGAASGGGARGYTMAGPGFEAPGLAWDLVRVR
jgi:YVTN family beta-propeller protein